MNDNYNTNDLTIDHVLDQVVRKDIINFADQYKKQAGNPQYQKILDGAANKFIGKVSNSCVTGITKDSYETFYSTLKRE